MMSRSEMTTQELERLLGHPLKSKWTMVLAPNGQLYIRESDGTWYAPDNKPARPARPKRRLVQHVG